MSWTRTPIWALIMGLVLLTLGCEAAPPTHRFGLQLTGVTFQFVDKTEGIHPSQTVLDNPNNPFRDVSISDTAKFDILTGGGSAGGFYAWATLLARVPTGEHQFYAANKLDEVYLSGEVTVTQRETVRQMAIGAYQAVLDHFPNSVSYDATGTVAYRLATPAYKAIVALGGQVKGGWVLVKTATDGEEAVQGGVVPRTPQPPVADDPDAGDDGATDDAGGGV